VSDAIEPARTINDEVTALRKRIAELEQNEMKLHRMENLIQASEERLKIQYRLTNIPTITWQKKGDDFIIADYNITMEDFTDGLIGNFLDKPASLIYQNRPDIQDDLHKCFNERSIIKRETPYGMFTNKKQKTIVFTFIYMPPDSVISHMEDITQRKEAEQKLLKSEKELRVLSAKLMSIEERHRKHVSRELHDSIGQYLTAIKFSMENTCQMLLEKQDISKSVTLLEVGINLLKQTIDEVRRIMMDLRPSILDDLGILATISWFCRELQAVYTGMHVEQDIRIREEDIPEKLKIIIYRILQEALNNAAKHSSANHLRISLKKVRNRLTLAVEDNGRGFDLEQVASSYDISVLEGLGLMSMKERAELSGGMLKITSQLDKGTSIIASWPWVLSGD
jgi:signal transduction histidine kinase